MLNEKETKEILTYTLILHQARKRLCLSLNEYSIADSIYHLSNNPKNKIKDWCISPKTELGNFIGISEQSVHTIIKKLIKNGLVEKDKTTKYLRATQLWYDNVVLLKLRSQTKKNLATLKKLEPETKESLIEGLKKLEPETKESLVNNNNNNNKYNNNKNNLSADADFREEKPKEKKLSWTAEILKWFEETYSLKVGNYGKQVKALGLLSERGFTVEQMRDGLKKMRAVDFWKDADFMDLYNQAHKFIKKKNVDDKYSKDVRVYQNV